MLNTKHRNNDILSLLLTGARLIEMPTLEQGYAASARLSTPLHKVLVMLGHVSQYKMDRALEAETMVNANELSTDLAVKALRIAATQQLTFQQALDSLGDEHKKTGNMPSASNEITDLLLEAGIINIEQIGRALNTSLETGMQMGRVLVFQREVPSLVMKAALTCALMLQEEKLGTLSAISAIRAVRNTLWSIEQVLFQYNLHRDEPDQGPKLNELFSMAGFVSESDAMECMEIHILRGRQIGQIYIEQGLITHEILDNAMLLLSMISGNSIKAFHAAEALKNAHGKQVSIYQALGELDPPAVPLQEALSFAQMLIAGELIDREVLDELIGGQELTARQLAKKVLAANLVDDKSCTTTLRCWSLNKEGFVSNRSSVEILKHCITYDASLDEQLHARGHFVPNRMQWIWR
ncbi:MAG: hypothetical protein C0469_14035 [Cyanobacteria bacterium DS2.3.42]|nr:hypothetical protein [Cyanobacteria bacterium DS2.3.42]